jgi:hypothetical protein
MNEANRHNQDLISVQARHERFIIRLYPRDGAISVVLITEDVLYTPEGMGNCGTQSFYILRVW